VSKAAADTTTASYINWLLVSDKGQLLNYIIC